MRLETVAYFCIAFACYWHLFIPPTIGIANNADWWRVELPVGLKASRPERYFEYALFDRISVPTQATTYITSEVPLVRIAKLLAGWTGSREHFRLEYAGAVHYSLWLVACALILTALHSLAELTKLTGCCGLALLAVDPANATWFNSLYGEAAALVFFLLSIAFALRVFIRPTWADVVGFAISWVLFAASKAQHYPLIVIGVVFLAIQLRRLRARAVVGVMLILAVGVGLLRANDCVTARSHRWQAVFFGAVRYSPTPDSDLLELGLIASDRPYIGTTSFAAPDAEVTRVARTIDPVRLAGFYLRHPDRLIRTMMALAGDTRVRTRMGNYSEDSGHPPKTLAFTFANWPTCKDYWLPMNLGVLLGLPILTAAAMWMQAPKPALLLPAAAVAQFVIVAYGEGTADARKHLVLFHFTWDICLLYLIAAATTAISARSAGSAAGWPGSR